MNLSVWVGGAIAAVAATGAMYFMGLGGVVRVVRAIFDAIGDLAMAVRDWLRKPGNKIRGMCAVFALAFLAAGLQSWRRGTVIVQQRQDYVSLKDKTDRERQALLGQVTERERTIERFVQLARQQKELLDKARSESQAALDAARRAQELAAQSERKYQDAFMQRPPECKAALEVMAQACPTLKDY